MNKFILIISLCILTISCGKSKKPDRSRFDYMKVSDQICLNEVEKARQDLRKGQLVYCNYVGNIGWNALDAEKEMDSLLRINNIQFKNESSPCVVQEDRNYHCYCQFMEDQIENKYGVRFADSLLNVADSLYIIKHLEEMYSDGSWDRPPVFPGDKKLDPTNHSGLQTGLEKVVEYPKAYKYKTNSNSAAMAKVYLEVDNTGKAKMTNCEFIFYNDDTKETEFNQEVYPKFKKIIRTLIEGTNWTPAKVKSISVKSENEIFVYFK